MGGIAGVNKIFETPLYPYELSADQSAVKAVHHPVVIIGAGPVGLCAAIDLAQRNIPVLVVDDNDKVSFGSRAICFAKRTLDICDRLGIGEGLVEQGVQWNRGKVFFDDRKVYEFNLLAQDGHKNPAFVNLQQYYLETYLVERIRVLQAQGTQIDIRGKTKLVALTQSDERTQITLETPDGQYGIDADWVIACDGANSPTRKMLGLDFVGRVFEDNFLIADVTMEADFPTERWFWFDPPFNKGQSALLHKQPDGVWRIDLQLGWDIDKEQEKKPENVIPRLKKMLGHDVKFELEWVSIYTFQCRRMERFVHERVIFAGDSAHQVSPFGARGANSGIQDVDNLCWKLAAVIDGTAKKELLETYNDERLYAADENISNSTRSTDFITPKSQTSRVFRDAVLTLAERHEFARPLVNSGRLSMPSTYPIDECDYVPDAPEIARPGAPAPDALLDDGTFLLGHIGGQFTVLSLNSDRCDLSDMEDIANVALDVSADKNPYVAERYLGVSKHAIYLIRPDQHIAARWDQCSAQDIRNAIKLLCGDSFG